MGLWSYRGPDDETLLAVTTWEAANNLLEHVHALRITGMGRD